jgi:hypothetical protein
LNVGFSSGTSEFQVRSTGVTIGNISTDRHLITGSLIVSASTNLTGSVTINESRIDNAWISYTPTWTADGVSNPAIGNGSLTGAYKIIGKTCFVRAKLVTGTTTTFGVGAWQFGLPVTASVADAIQLQCSMLDNGIAWYGGIVNGTYSGDTFRSAIITTTPSTHSWQGVQSSAPFTWGASDSLMFNGSYEIA